MRLNGQCVTGLCQDTAFGAGRSGTLPAEGGGDWSTCLLGLGRFGVGYVIAQTFDNLTTTKADDQQGAAGG